MTLYSWPHWRWSTTMAWRYPLRDVGSVVNRQNAFGALFDRHLTWFDGDDGMRVPRRSLYPGTDVRHRLHAPPSVVNNPPLCAYHADE